jgi:peptidylprolyl isomerase
MVCKSEKTVNKGDRIHIHYSGTTNDGEEFETTFDKEPFEMIVGETKIIPGFEKALIGMRENETIEVTFPPEEAYGHYDPSMIAILNKSELPKNSVPAVGWMMKIGTYTVTVKAIEGENVTLDGNHPLVGHHVNFKIQVLKILNSK